MQKCRKMDKQKLGEGGQSKPGRGGGQLCHHHGDNRPQAREKEKKTVMEAKAEFSALSDQLLNKHSQPVNGNFQLANGSRTADYRQTF